MSLLHWVIREESMASIGAASLPKPRASEAAASAGRRRTPGRRLLGGPSLIPALVLCAFLLVPLIGLLARAVGAGGVIGALGRPIVLEALRLSLVTSAAILLLALLLGSPLALLLARRRFRGIRLLDSLV